MTGSSSPRTRTLCPRCRKLDFGRFFRPPRLTRRLGWPVLALGEMPGTDPCPVCSFFHAMHLEGWPGEDCTLEVRLFSSALILDVKEVSYWAPAQVAVVVPKSDFRSVLRKLIDKKGYILPLSSSYTFPAPGTTVYGRRIEPLRVDYPLIRKWLEWCDANHGGPCRRGSASGPKALDMPLRCIDCQTHEIIQITPGDDYLALTYVWGAQHAAEAPSITTTAEDPPRLPPAGVPAVILDAIDVVLALGRRYLWVDKYCIDQNDAAAKGFQIRNMDLIYERAYLTIVAAAGSDAAFGLPGVRARPRQEQPWVRTPSNALVSTLATLPVALKESTWMTRGWTYQEAVLSRRLLFFTTLQAYFVCSAMTCCEAVVAGARDTHTGLRGRGHWTGIDVIIHREPIDQTATDLVVFANRIAAFSGRVLAYDADILDAFRGVLSRSPFYTYYGIPLAPCDSAERCRLASDPISTEVGFLRGLYWWAAYDFDLSRRDGFPSWSWSGWKGPVIFLTPFRDPMNHSTVKRPTPKETVWIEDGAGKLLSVSELRALASGGSTILPEISNYIHLDTYILRLRFQRQTSRVYAESSEHWSGYLKDVEAYFCSQHEFEEKWLRWWDCVLIHAMDQPYRPKFFLIVKWQGDTAYRVGSVEILDSVNRYESYIKPLLRKKRVRLG